MTLSEPGCEKDAIAISDWQRNLRFAKHREIDSASGTPGRGITVSTVEEVWSVDKNSIRLSSRATLCALDEFRP